MLTEKAGMWEGGTAFLYILGNTGRSPAALSDFTQAADNIDTTEDLKAYEAWYQQELFEGQLSLLFGLYDYNSEFYALSYAASLIHSSFGIGVDTSQVVPSIFSETSLAARVKYNPSAATYLQFAVTDGVPGDPFHTHGTRIRYNSEDGQFYAFEMGETSASDQTPTAYHKLAYGLWFSTATYTGFDGETRDNNNGMYLIGESSIYREDDEEQGLGFFMQVGYASKRKNSVEWYLGTGLNYVGPFESRDEDVLAFGIANARNGETYLNSAEGLDRTETAIELSYVFQALPYLSLQPDIQWIVNPGTESGRSDSIVGILRIQLAL